MNQLTVCICVYNGEKYIAETLESICAQTFQDFDLLIINDCSTDDTLKVIDDFFISHPDVRKRVVTLPENRGLAWGRHVAEKLVNTDYLLFFDADDIALPLYLEKLMAVITRDEKCMAVGCFCEYISASSERIGGGIYIGPKTKAEFFERARNEKLMFMSASSVVRVRDMKLAGGRNVNGFPEGKPRYQDMCEDLDLWTRMSDFYKAGKYIVVCNEVLFQYRKMPGSMSANSKAMSMRIRHIKCNLKRRRAGLMELTFSEFLVSLSRWQKIKYAYADFGQGFYKQAGFYYMQKKYCRFVICAAVSAIFSPQYIMQKFCSNVLPFFKQKKSSAGN